MAIGLQITIAALALFIAGLGVWLNFKRKEITYDIIDQTPLINWTEEIKGKLKLIFLGEGIEDAHSIVIQIKNTGNQSIAAKDFAQHFIFLFGKDAQILTYDIVQKRPDNLKLDLTIGLGDEYATSLIIEPFLLNRGESFVLKTLVSKFNGKVKVDARIADVKIRDLGVPSFWRETLLSPLIALPISIGILTVLDYFVTRSWNDFKLMIILGCCVFIFQVVNSYFSPRKR